FFEVVLAQGLLDDFQHQPGHRLPSFLSEDSQPPHETLGKGKGDPLFRGDHVPVLSIDYMYNRTYHRVMLSRKTRITIRINDDVLAWFRRQVRPSGGSYQTAIDLALRDYIAREPLEATLRRVIREELARAGVNKSPDAYGYESSRPALVAD